MCVCVCVGSWPLSTCSIHACIQQGREFESQQSQINDLFNGRESLLILASYRDNFQNIVGQYSGPEFGFVRKC